ETLETHAPAFWRWLDRAAGGRAEKRDVILAALFMVLANRYDWLKLFLNIRISLYVSKCLIKTTAITQLLLHRVQQPVCEPVCQP
ncbi:hypothetical protein MJO10_31620, partial [Salmonella enterica subsp. enterica serovar Anatum]|nr:hypothetical protein [Salmonella enterica subsp. enterica serovar Anatum]